MIERSTAIAILPATMEDRLVVVSLLENARAWLASRDIPQWTRPFDDEWITDKIAAGEWHVAYRHGTPVAIARLLWHDAFFWGARERGDAAYIHTLVVHRCAAGQGVGARILAWASARARARGRRYLRLDCNQENRALVAYYMKQGFLPIGQVEIAGEVMQLMEKALAD